MLFSVVIPVFNRRQILPRALQSIQTQTFQDFEVIVVDDGSTDDPSSVVASLMDERFKCIVQENSGPASARNQGARLARGDVITFLDSDDEALQNWLESMDRAFEQHQAVIVCCGSESIDGGQTFTLLPRDKGKLFDNAKGHFGFAGVFAMRREAFDRIGGYDPKVWAGEHTEMVMRLLPIAQEEGWKIHNIMEPLIRKHNHGRAGAGSNPYTKYSSSTYVLEKHKRLFEKDAKWHSGYHAVAGVNAARIGLLVEARHHLRKSAMLNPTSIKAWLRMVVAHAPGFMTYWWHK